MFPVKYDGMISENKIVAHSVTDYYLNIYFKSTRQTNKFAYLTLQKYLANYLERVVKYPPYRDHPEVVNKHN
jgi:hypothetical protein